MSIGPKDTLARPLRDLRVSVTDRCNLRCTYCMPAAIFDASYRFLPREDILTYEEIARLARVSATLGVRKLRITGGEPLLRRDLDRLVALFAAIKGIDDVALTTNGLLLPQTAKQLKAAGLSRLTVSLDSLDDTVFGRMNGRGVPVRAVLDGIEAARNAGFANIKLNMVVQRGTNDHEIVDMARRVRGTGITVRFIEFMDVGVSNGWRLESVVPAAEVIARISAEFPLEPVEPNYKGEVAGRWRYKDGGGEIGVISSVTAPFCGGCSRARLSARGELFTCLFASRGTDLRGPLRGGADDDELSRLVSQIWSTRTDRYSEIRASVTDQAAVKKVEMSYIGG